LANGWGNLDIVFDKIQNKFVYYSFNTKGMTETRFNKTIYNPDNYNIDDLNELTDRFYRQTMFYNNGAARTWYEDYEIFYNQTPTHEPDIVIHSWGHHILTFKTDINEIYQRLKFILNLYYDNSKKTMYILQMLSPIKEYLFVQFFDMNYEQEANDLINEITLEIYNLLVNKKGKNSNFKIFDTNKFHNGYYYSIDKIHYYREYHIKTVEILYNIICNKDNKIHCLTYQNERCINSNNMTNFGHNPRKN